VVDFFQNKFPTLAANPFYITGESYAGVYVPTLARWIVDHNDQDGSFKINLKGIAAGDPCTDNKFQADSVSCFLPLQLSFFLFPYGQSE
jgi:cathepsin A (carboxypeptidase C)